MQGRSSSLSALASLAIPVASGGEGREYRAYPTLAGARWLFPAGRPAVRRAGMRELFRPGSPKGRVAKRLISSGIFPGGKLFLDGPALAELEAELSRVLNEPVGVAFYVGTPGAYRKVTAQAVTPAGASLAFAKLAATPAARSDVEAERRNLLRLAENEALGGRVPALLGFFGWQGCDVLLVGGGPARPGPSELSPDHLGFLTDFFVPFSGTGVFAEGSMLVRLSERTRLLESRVPGSLHDVLDGSLAELRDGLGPVDVPVAPAHRDFAPWNTRIGPRGLFVFDWDRVEEGVTPLYDAFHFQAIQAALFGGREPVPDRAFLRQLLDAVWPSGEEHVPYLHLAYLLDQALFYAEARATAPEAGEGGVLDWFVERLAAFPGESPRL